MSSLISIYVKNYVNAGSNALAAHSVEFALIVSRTRMRTEDTYINEILIEEIYMNEKLLQRYCENGMIKTAEAAKLKHMIFSKKERCVLKVHKNKFCRRNDGRHSADYCYTSIKTENGRKKISGSYCDVISKLYSIYFGDDDQDLTFSDIRADFEAWYAVGRQPATLMVDCKVYGTHINAKSRIINHKL